MALSRSLAEAANRFGAVAEDERLGPLLKNMHKQSVGGDFGKLDAGDKLSAEGVQGAADRHMPLCMKVARLEQCTRSTLSCLMS